MQRAKARSSSSANEYHDVHKKPATNDVALRSKSDRDVISPIPASLSPRLEDQAIWFFFNNYHAEETGFSKGYFADIPVLYNQMRESEALSLAINSIGMASISNIRGNPQARIFSRRDYTKALRLINLALQDPVEVKKDETVIIGKSLAHKT